jgi:hypothetical protein
MAHLNPVFEPNTDIEGEIDSANVFQGVVLEVDELRGAEVERRRSVYGPGACRSRRRRVCCTNG